MASFTVNLERVALDSLTDSILFDLPGGKVVELYGDGTVEVWSPTELYKTLNVL